MLSLQQVLNTIRQILSQLASMKYHNQYLFCFSKIVCFFNICTFVCFVLCMTVT